jgi:hypothetical protein
MWMHLRVCQTCGRIGCCDSSPHRHAFGARNAGHPIARSDEPEEEWSWCYVDEVEGDRRERFRLPGSCHP